MAVSTEGPPPQEKENLTRAALRKFIRIRITRGIAWVRGELPQGGACLCVPSPIPFASAD